MALRRAGIVSPGATTVAAILLSACGSNGAAVQTSDPVSGSTPSSAATPRESAEERRQREDKAAAETSYEFVQDELERLSALGGAKKTTPVLEAYATGAYLNVQMRSLRRAKADGLHAEGAGRTSVTANQGWSPTRIGLTACEDFTDVEFVDRRGRETLRDRPRMFVQTLTADKVGDQWKIASLKSKPVDSFENESGCEDF